MINRRLFLKRSGMAATVGLAAPVPFSMARKLAASGQVRVGLIGCNNRGWYVLRHMLLTPGVTCLGLCDVDSRVSDQLLQTMEETGVKPKYVFKDFRQLLELKDLDAVIVATPDHWHALITNMALDAGKHVYVEKPMAYNIEESQAMVDKANETGLVVQVGQQQRSGPHWQEMVQRIQSGDLGKVSKVKVWANFNYGKGPQRVPDSPVPPELDFDMWLGPAPAEAYNESRVEGWRFQWAYGGGLMTDFGAHMLDIAIWGLDIDQLPQKVYASGGIYRNQDRQLETPDTLSVIYQYPEVTVTWDHLGGVQRGPYDRIFGIAFYGERGVAVADRSSYDMLPVHGGDGEPLNEEHQLKSQEVESNAAHTANFIQAIRDDAALNCTVRDGQRAAVMSHLGNLAYLHGGELSNLGSGWNPDIPGARRNYHGKWSLK